MAQLLSHALLQGAGIPSEQVDLLIGERCPRIALQAAYALAGPEVADEMAVKQVERDQRILNGEQILKL